MAKGVCIGGGTSATWSVGSSSADRWLPLGSNTTSGGEYSQSTESRYQWAPGKSITVDVFGARCDTASVTYYLRKNGVNTGLSFLGAATEDWVSDTGSESFTSTDLISVFGDHSAGTTPSGQCFYMGFDSGATSSAFWATGQERNYLATATYWEGLSDRGTTSAANDTTARDYVQVAGDVAYLQMIITANTLTDPSTVALRKNSTTTALSASVPSATTGRFTDTTNTVSVAVGDLLGLEVDCSVSGGGSMTGVTTAVRFDSGTANTLPMLIGSFSGSTAGVRQFALIAPSTESSGTATVQMRVPYQGSFRNFAVLVTANTNPNNETLVVHNASLGADTTLGVTVTASTTGKFESTNEIFFGSDTNFCLSHSQVNTGVMTYSGGGFIYEIFEAPADPTGTSRGTYGHTSQIPTAGAVTAGTYYNSIAVRTSGTTQVSATEDTTLVYAPAAISIKNASIWVRTNNNVGATYTLRKNGVNTALAITVPNNTSGNYSDTTNKIDYVAGDSFCYEAVITNSGTPLYNIASMTFDILREDAGATSVYSAILHGSNQDRISGLASSSNASSTTVDTHGDYFNYDMKWSRLGCYVTTNPRTTSTTYTLRVGGTPLSPLIVTIPSSTTGLFEDTTSEAYSQAGTRVSLFFDVGSGATVMDVYQTWVWGENLESQTISTLIKSSNGDRAVGSNAAFYSPAVGPMAQWSSSSASDMRYYSNEGTVKGAWAWIASNSMADTETITLQNNAVDTAIAFSIPAATTGHFASVTDVAIANGDYLRWSTSIGSSVLALSGRNFSIAFEALPYTVGGATLRRIIIIHD